MGLTEQLADLRQQLGREIPRETLAQIGQFVQGLVQSGIEETACQTGDKVPSFILPNLSGKMVAAGEILARGPMVLSFYRGVW